MSNVVSIHAYEAIEPPALHILGQSYDAALGILETSGSMSTGDRETLAFAMLGFVRQGVNDPAALTQHAVKTFESMKQQQMTG